MTWVAVVTRVISQLVEVKSACSHLSPQHPQGKSSLNHHFWWLNTYFRDYITNYLRLGHHLWCFTTFDADTIFLFLTRWCPSSLAKLVYNSHFTMVYGRYNYSIHGLYKPTNFTGGHHPGWLKTYFVDRCEGSIQLSGWPGSARSEDSGAPSPPVLCTRVSASLLPDVWFPCCLCFLLGAK